MKGGTINPFLQLRMKSSFKVQIKCTITAQRALDLGSGSCSTTAFCDPKPLNFWAVFIIKLYRVAGVIQITFNVLRPGMECDQYYPCGVNFKNKHTDKHKYLWAGNKKQLKYLSRGEELLGRAVTLRLIPCHNVCIF